jgi:outer membrane protein insertion porin family
VGYIFGDGAPLYERFYLGGRSLRGFDFRTVSPKGIDRTGAQTNDPVGGDWLVFLGAQYEFPLLTEALTGVIFLDTGTVIDDPGIDDYRAAIGAGIRIYIPQFGPVPIAFDFATPLRKERGDDTQVFSFSAELPF